MRLQSVMKGLAAAFVVFAFSHASLLADDHGQNFALQFIAANGSLATGPFINQNDNMRMEAVVRYDGPSAHGGLLFYNGNGCCNGWGLVVYGADTGSNAGRLGILAGGILVADTAQPMMLPVGEWQRIRIESRNQHVTLSFPGETPGPAFSVGIVPRNNLNFEVSSSMIVGEGFNGLIKDVRITSLGTPNTLLELWRFNEGQGSIATGVNGGTLNLTNTTWVRLREDNDHK